MKGLYIFIQYYFFYYLEKLLVIDFFNEMYMFVLYYVYVLCISRYLEIWMGQGIFIIVLEK